LRTSAWWTTKRRYDVLKRRGLDYSHLTLNGCPCCGDDLEEDDEISHILLDCGCWNAPRKRYLNPLLSILKNEIVNKGKGALAPQHNRLEIVMRLLGGHFTSPRESNILKENNNCVERNTGVLELFARGWGGHPEYYTPGLGTHGYVPVAVFLAKVMPKHKACLFPAGKGNTDPVAYKTTSEEESPMVTKGAVSNAVSYDSWVEDGDEYLYRRPKNQELLQPVEQVELQVEAQKSMTDRCSSRARRTHALYFSDDSTDEGTDF
jgi:hypothetical protein